MNQAIVRIFMVITLLFMLLIGFTSRWTVFESDQLQANDLNRRGLIRQERQPRGVIVAADGKVLARSVSNGKRREQRRYLRSYPTGELFAHAVGYAFTRFGETALEAAWEDDLTGKREEILTVADELLGRNTEGRDIKTTLRSRAQQTAMRALAAAPGNKRGAVVVIEPSTGRIPVMASLPSYDPNEIPERFSRITRAEGSPIFNRATQANSPPGSTFKVVTAAAALDSGQFTPNDVIDGSSPKDFSGRPLANFGGRDWGRISLTTALTNSVNTVWAQIAERLGKQTLYDYMDRFGFNTDPPLEFPDSQMAPSGVYSGGRLLDADNAVDVARLGIGQERLQVTPLQMAMVAATIANRGVRMKPLLVREVVDRDGRTVETIKPDRVRRVMSARAAEQLADMMRNVVREGTGTAAALSGINVAGKTGTAEVDGATSNQAWFIGFAPVRNPRYAIAVTVERTTGQGGTVAAPIAKQVLQELLR